MLSPAQAADQIVRCCRRLADAGLIAGQDGNVSVRVGADRLLVTPRGRLTASLAPADLVLDFSGDRIGGFREPTSELDLPSGYIETVPMLGRWSMRIHPRQQDSRWQERGFRVIFFPRSRYSSGMFRWCPTPVRELRSCSGPSSRTSRDARDCCWPITVR